MKRVLQFGIAALALSQISAKAAVGSIIIQNNNGATIVPIFDVDGTTKIGGLNYKAAVFVANPDGSVGAQIGSDLAIGANGRFTGGQQNIGVAGSTVNLLVEAWDLRTGATYATATTKGISAVFASPTLGGDADNDPTTPALVALSMATNFKSFNLIAPEPSTVALAALGLGGLVFISRRK